MTGGEKKTTYRETAGITTVSFHRLHLQWSDHQKQPTIQDPIWGILPSKCRRCSSVCPLPAIPLGDFLWLIELMLHLLVLTQEACSDILLLSVSVGPPSFTLTNRRRGLACISASVSQCFGDGGGGVNFWTTWLWGNRVHKGVNGFLCTQCCGFVSLCVYLSKLLLKKGFKKEVLL